MGLTFYYSGKFKQGASLTEMIDEVKDVAEAYKWPYHIFETEFTEPATTATETDKLFGICFTPPECETISFLFLSNRRMTGLLNWSAWKDASTENKEDHLFTPFTKTQYAGEDIHKIVVNLFRHISPRYFEDFKLSDEGEYWETGDEKKLHEAFVRFTAVINSFTSALETIPRDEGESLEDYLERMAHFVDKERKKE